MPLFIKSPVSDPRSSAESKELFNISPALDSTSSADFSMLDNSLVNEPGGEGRYSVTTH
ncbi:hypothetical protein FWK35_00015500 [Aphis craccivora]|uniref:Uncharacterized protein n=1 Tax=Aphis craccivora TaxID=307492 RepID=A0A6G0YLL1_APHCR|nr:hypothetical protein FWK35_00015500 [Aphis craccivora]